MLALPIFPGRHQPSIVGRDELNYRVRNGNGWTLALISTNFIYVIRYDRKTSCIINFSCALVKIFPALRRTSLAHRRQALVHLHGLEPGTH